MKTEWKAKWLAALRSGDYKQATSRLKESDTCLCCLGVIGDLAVKEGLATWERNESFDENSIKPARSAIRESNLLPAYFAENKFGLTYPQQQKLAAMNDDGQTFSEIADYIEEKL